MSTRLSQLIVLLLAIAAGLGVGYGLWGAERSQSTTSASATRVSDNGEALRLDALADARRRARARLERLQPPSGDEERALRSPRTPRYAVHREKGRTLGVPRVTATSEIDAHVEAGRLVPLVDTEYYVVRALEHSAPFVTPDLRQLLSEIGERFQRGLAERGLPPYRFVISSALRTPALQEDLRQSNRNAASQASSHEYGVSVDIVTWRYAVGSRSRQRSGSTIPTRLTLRSTKTCSTMPLWPTGTATGITSSDS